MISGVLRIDKPAGISSAQALAAVKKRLGCKKIGHAGTLDPMATGLLVCLTEGATRFAQYAAAGGKCYTGTIAFGITTDTDDIEGRVLRRSAEIPDFDAICRAGARFAGAIDQVPPQVSALKVNGARGYELARRGETVPLQARPVVIEEFTLGPAEAGRAHFSVRCSKGTYVRAIARDLGAALGCGACLAALRRTASLPFDVQGAKAIEQVGPQDIEPWEQLFPGAARLELPPGEVQLLRRGDLPTVSRICRDLRGCGQAIYREAHCGEWLGLLVEADGGWRFGVNLAQ